MAGGPKTVITKKRKPELNLRVVGMSSPNRKTDVQFVE